jgi:hypothetical protein
VVACQARQRAKPLDTNQISTQKDEPAAQPEESTIPEQATLPDDYLPFTMRPARNKWIGTCEHLPGFGLSLDLPGSIIEDDPNEKHLISIIKSRPTAGTLEYPNGRTTPIAYEIVNHRGTQEIYMKSSLGYFLWEHVRITEDEIRFAIYWWYTPPAQKQDLEILSLAEQLLADPTHWHQDDDRQCEDDEKENRWSLFCALKVASMKVAKEYNHHNTAIQTVRFTIDDKVPNHGFAHTLMDYNNAPTTTHGDILSCIEASTQRIKTALGE